MSLLPADQLTRETLHVLQRVSWRPVTFMCDSENVTGFTYYKGLGNTPWGRGHSIHWDLGTDKDQQSHSTSSFMAFNPTGQSELLGPGEVISARLESTKFFDDEFEHGPESNGLKRVVEPAGSYTEIGLVWRHVVDAVMLAWEDDV